jgi:DNA modification methylase
MIHHGDLFTVLPTLDANSVDACVTDPPYGIGFMGREWDTFTPAVAAKKQGLRQINKSEHYTRKEKRLINPNLKGRTVDGAISSSQIEYDRTLAGQRGFQDWTARSGPSKSFAC